MPDIGNFGFLRVIKRAYFEQPANGFIYHFDRANHKIRIFQDSGVSGALVELGNVAVPAVTLNMEMVGQ
jgi:hypothetical protein